MAELNYKVDTEAPETSIEPVPAGTYPVVIEASEYVSNKQGTGNILKLTYQIIDGPKKGFKVFENLNLENQSQQAEQIARKALNSIGMAVGILHIQDTEELHNIPLYIDVSVKDDPKYGLQNNVKKHISMKDDNTKSAPVQEKGMGLQNPQPVAQEEVKKKPWEK